MKRFVLRQDQAETPSATGGGSWSPSPDALHGADGDQQLADDAHEDSIRGRDRVGSETQRATPIKVTQHSALIEVAELESTERGAVEDGRAPSPPRNPSLLAEDELVGIEQKTTVVSNSSPRLARDTLPGVPAIARPGEAKEHSLSTIDPRLADGSGAARRPSYVHGHGPSGQGTASPTHQDPRRSALRAWIFVAVGFFAGVLTTLSITAMWGDAAPQAPPREASAGAGPGDEASATAETPVSPSRSATGDGAEAGGPGSDEEVRGEPWRERPKVRATDRTQGAIAEPNEELDDEPRTDEAVVTARGMDAPEASPTRVDEPDEPAPPPIAPPEAVATETEDTDQPTPAIDAPSAPLPDPEPGLLELAYPEVFEGNDPWPIRGSYAPVKRFGRELQAKCAGNIDLVGFAEPGSDDETRIKIGRRRAIIVRTNLEQMGFARKRLEVRAAGPEEALPAAAEQGQEVLARCSTTK